MSYKKDRIELLENTVIELGLTKVKLLEILQEIIADHDLERERAIEGYEEFFGEPPNLKLPEWQEPESITKAKAAIHQK